MPPVICVDVIELSHEHGLLYLAHIQDFQKMCCDAGAQKCCFFITEAGGSDEVIVVSKWNGIQARSNAMETIKKSHLKEFLTLGKSIAHHQNYTCVPDPAVAPPTEHEFTKNIGVRMYKVNGNPFVAAAKYAEISAHMKQKAGLDFNLLGILHPVAFTGAVSLIVLVEEGATGMDGTLEKVMQLAQDPSEAATMKTVFENYVPLSVRICKPFNVEKFCAAVKEAGIECPKH